MKNLSTIPRMKRMFAAALLLSLMSAMSFAQSVLFRDDFNGSMQSGWTWTRENPGTWSLTSTGLQIESEYGDLWQGWTNNCRNMLLRPAPSSDFTIEAKLEVSLVAPINQAHILLYYNDDYYVRFGPVLSYGYQVVIDVVHEVGGGIAHQSAVSWGNNLVYLKIQKSGPSASCYYSSDGLNWTLHHTISNLNFSVDQVGLVAFDGSEPPSASVATYDYFQISELPPPECVTPPSSLVSWWPGEDNANDIQGSNHGTLINGATFATGIVEQAFSFDGVDDYVSVPDNTVWDFGMNDFTIDLWVNFDQIKESMFIHQESGATFGGFEFDFQAHISSLVFSWDGHGVFSRAWSPLTNRWYHLAVTRTSGAYRMYVDGAQLGSDQFDSNPIAEVTGNLRIGSWSGGAHYTVDGLIDEVDIYNRALSASEIQSIYNAGSAGKCTNTPPPVCVNPPSGLISWWPGDGNANDIQGSNHGTLQNGATFAMGKVGQAFSFDGVDDFVEIPENGFLDLNNEFSMEVWVNPSGTPGNIPIPIASKYNYANGSYPSTSYELSIFDGGKVQFGITCGTNTMYKHTANTVVEANVFTHVAAIYRINPMPSLDIYVNGVEVAGTTFGQNCNYINQNDTPFRIGMRIDSQSSAFFAGLIDEVSIFNRALSASEIQSIYTAGSAGKCKECTPPEVSVTGNESVCPNSTHPYTATTNADNPTFEWSVTGGMINGDNTGSSIDVAAGGAGMIAVSVEVTDGTTSCSNSATQNVTVEDTEAPIVTVGAAPIVLWPPNHKYITIDTIMCGVSASDNCTPLSVNEVVISKVTSDEPENATGNGDGNTLNDIVIAEDCKSVQLRRERQGSGNGRVYTIYWSANDGNGNTGTATCLVTVPHSQNGNPAMDDGIAYEVLSDCDGIGKLSGNAGITTEQETLPEEYALLQNYPNPFNPTTEITFALPEAGEVTLAIYNTSGQLVRMLVSGEKAAGRHSVVWDANDEYGTRVASGVYVYVLRAGEFVAQRKLVLMK